MPLFGGTQYWKLEQTQMTNKSWLPESIHARYKIMSCCHLSGFRIQAATKSDSYKWRPVSVRSETHCYYTVCYPLSSQWALSEQPESSRLFLLPSKLFVKGGEIDEGTRPENERKLNYCSDWEKKKNILIHCWMWGTLLCHRFGLLNKFCIMWLGSQLFKSARFSI